MTERDLNRIINYYNELEHYINEYTDRFLISDIIKKSPSRFDGYYYIDHWETFNEDSFYIVIKNNYMLYFVDIRYIQKEDLIKFINEEYGDRAFDGFRSE